MTLTQSRTATPIRNVVFLLLVGFLPAVRAAGTYVTVDQCLPADTPGLTATVGGVLPGCTQRLWFLTGGTITSGQGTDTITFTSGPPATAIRISVVTCFDPGRPAIGLAGTYPVADASGGATICPGLGTQLTGSGAASCEWIPADGLSDPDSCAPIAGPSETTTYSLVVRGPMGCESTNAASTTVTVLPGPEHALTVDRCLPSDTPGLVASVSGGSGETYVWEVAGGTITAGQSTNNITFTSGPAGSAANVSVTVTGEGCAGFKAESGQVDFGDVPPSDIFYADVCTIGRNRITVGCGGGNFCRDAPVRRDQMAVLLLKAKHGGSYQAPPCSGIFDDVACPGPFTDWVEQLAVEGITAGCGELNYCPDRTVTRAQMAALLLKSSRGSSYVPLPCQSIFGDVPCPGPFADWIEALYVEGITAGCQASPRLYCPDSGVTRGQMAALIVNTFPLP